MTQSAITVAVLVAGVLLAIVQQQGWPKEWSALGFIATPGWLIWLYGRAELQWDTLYQWRAGLWARATNPTVNWSSQFMLYGVGNQTALEELQAWLAEHYRREDTTVLANSEHSFSLSVRGVGTITIERTSRHALAADLSQTEPAPGDALVIELPAMSSGYRDALRWQMRSSETTN
jgi:hypothetical protein